MTCDKGIPELFTAFERILTIRPNSWLLLAGWFDSSEDRLSGVLRQRIEAHPRVVVTGFVQETELYLRAMNLLVLPTWREGFPNAVLEASAVGLPVVTTTATGARDAVVPGETGLLVSPGSPDALCEALLGLLADPEDCKRMGRAGRAWVEEHFSREVVLARLVHLYEQWLQTGEAPSSGSGGEI